MLAKKLLITFLVISLIGHLLALLLAGFVDMTGGSEREGDIITVDLKESLESPEGKKEEKEKVKPIQSQIEEDNSEYLKETVEIDSNDGKYIDYLRKIQKMIESNWIYPQKAYEKNEEGNTVVKFSITNSGALLTPIIMRSSGSKLLDKGAISAVKAAAPYDPLPLDFNLLQLNIIAKFKYRMTE
ncbi:MAG: TonB family protein [Syntrophales bacterium]